MTHFSDMRICPLFPLIIFKPTKNCSTFIRIGSTFAMGCIFASSRRKTAEISKLAAPARWCAIGFRRIKKRLAYFSPI